MTSCGVICIADLGKELGIDGRGDDLGIDEDAVAIEHVEHLEFRLLTGEREGSARCHVALAGGSRKGVVAAWQACAAARSAFTSA